MGNVENVMFTFRVAYGITYVGNESNCPYHHYVWITTNSFRSLFCIIVSAYCNSCLSQIH